MIEVTEADRDYRPRILTVNIRRNFERGVRPNAEQIDGKTYSFVYLWLMDENDPYPGESAWGPEDSTYPADAPHWIASGDLTT